MQHPKRRVVFSAQQSNFRNGLHRDVPNSSSAGLGHYQSSLVAGEVEYLFIVDCNQLYKPTLQIAAAESSFPV
ncbi:hypothetical protein KL929_000835 [Ogataea haglerorum]|uniref:uncharacterized protein n=1 Tax=Ogataea haglerorum TaxID=1937702 RepID=UPI001C89A0B7|nr:uncharacterized protein KL911_003539 [Ogataea haglerorum]KAG7701826.1 hypothetical protein KL951_000282 [Ogataea haglerorum]KAG7751093.1 hypothetical protein KL912_000226 [Ogataea haglerorum]KAG7752808.1 hypothetical protein KL911_003539 [Ogataea haglerorum]KAG7799919.1 hypothetical protein KL929_000835 [Ogataea haglerorum]KAG7803989.1 hypothetical protein KL944_000858 [Ogataea haglerorum]